MTKRINTMRDAEAVVAKNIADPEWNKEADDDMRKARLFAADVLAQARENHFHGGTLVGASAYIMAAAIASTTPKAHMSDEVREFVVEQTIGMMRYALKDLRRHAEENGL